MKHASGFLAIVNDAKTRVKQWDFREVKRRLDAGETLTFVDVREDHEWARGHLPGAVHLSKGVIERDIEAKVPDKSAPLVLYCGGGYRSALAADNLQKMGYTNVISLVGLTLLALAVRAAETAHAPAPEHGFLSRTFKGADGREVKYSVFVPH